MREWKDVEAGEFDEEHCTCCQVRARLARGLVATQPQTAEEIATLVADVVFALPLNDLVGFVTTSLEQEVPARQRARRRVVRAMPH